MIVLSAFLAFNFDLELDAELELEVKTIVLPLRTFSNLFVCFVALLLCMNFIVNSVLFQTDFYCILLSIFHYRISAETLLYILHSPQGCPLQSWISAEPLHLRPFHSYKGATRLWWSEDLVTTTTS